MDSYSLLKSNKLAAILIFILVLMANSAFGQLDIQIQQVDANNFPFIFVVAGVTNSGNPVGDLNTSNFSATEDGRNQTSYFDVTPPDNSGGVRLVDFVFLIDNSGSMQPEINAVRNNVNAFADQMVANGIDLRLGAVRFGQSAGGGQPQIFNNGNLTGDLSVFHSWINQMYASGGVEPGLLAVQQAATTFNFRAGSQRHFLLITDEENNGGGTLSGSISACQSNNVRVHVAVDCGYYYPYAYNHYCRPITSISGATGGLVFSVMGPYNDILNAIGQSISNTYVIRYRTDNPNYDGQQRTVRVNVNAFNQSDYALGYYTPGAGPQITRTPETINLSSVAQVAGSPLTIAANIIDNIPPGIANAKLYYKIVGQSSFSFLNMTNLGTLYSAQIPGGSVVTPGVQYYITATDGQLTSSDPSVEPGINPYNIAVLPNVAPSIVHTPVSTANAGSDIIITASVVDNTHSIASVIIYYRRTGTLLYALQSMALQGGNTYTGTIPSSAVTADGVDYYIRATDDLGIFTNNGPHHVTVSEMTAYIAEKIQLAQDILNIQRLPTFYPLQPLFHVSEQQALDFANEVNQDNNNGIADPLDVQGVARLALSERVTKQAVIDATTISAYGGKGLMSIVLTIVLGKACDWMADHVRNIPWIGHWAADALKTAERHLDSATKKLVLIFKGNFKSTLLPIAKQHIAEKVTDEMMATAMEGTIEETVSSLGSNEFGTGLFDKAENAFGNLFLDGLQALAKNDQQAAVSYAHDHDFNSEIFETAKADATSRLQDMTAQDAFVSNASNFLDTVTNYAAIVALIASIVALVIGFFISGGILSLVAGIAAIVATLASMLSIGAAVGESAVAGVYVVGVMPFNYLNPSVNDAFGHQVIMADMPSLGNEENIATIQNVSVRGSEQFPIIADMSSHYQQVYDYYLRFRQSIVSGDPTWFTIGLDSLSYYQGLAAQDEEKAIADFFAVADSAEKVLPTYRVNCDQFLSLGASKDLFSASLSLFALPAKYGSADSNYVTKMIETLDSCLAKYTLLTALGEAIYDSIDVYSIPIPASVGMGDIKWSLIDPQLNRIRLEAKTINYGNTIATAVLVQPHVNAQSATIIGDSTFVTDLAEGDTATAIFDLQLSDSTCTGFVVASRTNQSNEFYTMPGREFTVDLHGFKYEVGSQFTPWPWNINWINKPKSTVQAIIRNLPQGYMPTDIIPGSIRLNATVPIVGRLKIDNDDEPKAIASFGRRDAILSLGNPPNQGDYRCVITGAFTNGTQFITDCDIKLVP